MTLTRIIAAAAAFASIGCHAFTTNSNSAPSRTTSSIQTSVASTTNDAEVGNIHGQNSCFLPLLQNDEDYIPPRTVQIAGAYPGTDVKTYLALTSEPSAELGAWNYDFSDPNGPQLGTIALPGIATVYESEDPVALISDHFSLGVLLPETLVDPVDLVVLCDRARTYFTERKFLVLELEDSPGVLTIAAFEAFVDMPANANILGHVTMVQIPWLPSMKKKRSGFLEEDQLYS